MADVWSFLFLNGEFAPRTHTAGLTLEQVAARPGTAPHSIYEELRHTGLGSESCWSAPKGLGLGRRM